MNGKKCRVGGGWVLHLLYNIRGVVSRNVIQCYIGWGGGQKFPIFALYNMCTTPYMKNKQFRTQVYDADKFLIKALFTASDL